MKETQSLIPDKVHEIKAERKAEIKYLGSMVIQPGHILFQFNIKTMELTEAEVETKVLVNGKTGQKNTRRKVIRKSDCIYLPALNLKNAERKLLKIFKSKSNE